MLYRAFGFLTFNPLVPVLSILMIVAIPLGVLRLVFSIGNWKTRMGFLPRFESARCRVSTATFLKKNTSCGGREFAVHTPVFNKASRGVFPGKKARP
jgi:hypothetical protein